MSPWIRKPYIHVQGLGSVFGVSFTRSGDTIRNYRDHATKCDDA